VDLKNVILIGMGGFPFNKEIRTENERKVIACNLVQEGLEKPYVKLYVQCGVFD
jgi:hypothetical protein